MPMKHVLALAFFLLLGGCAQYTDNRGIEVSWDPASVADFEVGKTTRNQVMARLGPPSQVISMGDDTVLYYLYERTAGTGLILIVYNRFDVDTHYDRAVFFFDGDDQLTEFSTRTAPAIDAG